MTRNLKKKKPSTLEKAPLGEVVSHVLAEFGISAEHSTLIDAMLGKGSRMRRALCSDSAAKSFAKEHLTETIQTHLSKVEGSCMLKVEAVVPAGIAPIAHAAINRKEVVEHTIRITRASSMVTTCSRVFMMGDEEDGEVYLAATGRAFVFCSDDEADHCKSQILGAKVSPNPLGLPSIRAAKISSDGVVAAVDWLFPDTDSATLIRRNDAGKVGLSKVALRPDDAVRLIEVLSQSPLREALRGSGAGVGIVAAIRKKIEAFQNSRSDAMLLTPEPDPWVTWARVRREVGDPQYLPLRFDDAIKVKRTGTRRGKPTSKLPFLPKRPGSKRGKARRGIVAA